jgi:hypothetical protein
MSNRWAAPVPYTSLLLCFRSQRGGLCIRDFRTGILGLLIKTFSTDSVPPGERPRVWREIIADLAKVDFRTEPTGTAPLSATITNYVGRRLRFSAYTFSPHVTTYNRRGGGRGEAGHLILSYLKQGNAIVMQDGREACVSAGDIVLFDPARPVRIKAAMRVHSFDLGAEQIKTLLPQVDALTSIALKQDGGAGSILRCVLDELIAASGNLDDEISDRIADAVPHLVAAAFTTMPEAWRVVPGRTDAYHLARFADLCAIICAAPISARR